MGNSSSKRGKEKGLTLPRSQPPSSSTQPTVDAMQYWSFDNKEKWEDAMLKVISYIEREVNRKYKSQLELPEDLYPEIVKWIPRRSYRVFFDMKADKEKLGRIEFQLFNKIVPKTAEVRLASPSRPRPLKLLTKTKKTQNFRALCTGEKGNCKVAKTKKLHYKGSIFHRVIPDFS